MDQPESTTEHSYDEKCRELAGHVLSLERGLNTPSRRQELAESLKHVIDTYLLFERGKARYGRKPP